MFKIIFISASLHILCFPIWLHSSECEISAKKFHAPQFLTKISKEIQIPKNMPRFVNFGKNYRNDNISRAYRVAAYYHRDQVRKFDKTPYMHHPVRVAKILSELNVDADTIKAALLHDVLEDTGIGEAEIKNYFGEKILLLVKYVTANAEELARLGKQEYWNKKIKEMPLDALLIKLADRWDNTRDFSTHNISFIKKYLPQGQGLVESALLRDDLTAQHHHLITKIKNNLKRGQEILLRTSTI